MTRTLVAAALTAGLLVLAGCGGGGSSSSDESGDTLASVQAQVDGLTGKEREAKLLELVEQEGGSVTFYTSQGSSKAEDLVAAFEDAYPDVDVALYRANSETILPRLAEESKAGFRGADAIHVQGLAMTSLHDDGLIGDYTPPNASDLIPGAVRDGWTVDSINSFVANWNTKLVPPGQEPHSWEDLADPRWKGKLAIEPGDVDWYKTLHDHFVQDKGMSEEQADELFQKIARNALVVHGHTNMAQLMAAGEADVGVNYGSTVDRTIEDGAPLAWHPPVTPLIQEPEGLAPAADPKHPAAALLYLDWAFGKGGQKQVVENGNDPVLKELSNVDASQTKLVDTAALAKVEDEWSTRFEQLLRLGKKAPDG